MNILKTNPGASDFHLFENLPKVLYPGQEQSKNIDEGFLVACYVLIDNDEPKARLALYQNPHLILNDQATACIGYYESVDNGVYSNRLISFATKEAKERGAKYLIGPMNGSTWSNYRFSTNHTEANFLMEPYHHLYYNEQFTAAGFSVLSNYFSGLDTTMAYNHPAIIKREEELLQDGLKIREINLAEYEEELKKLYPFITNAFKTNFLYSPITWESFRDKYLQSKEIIDPKFVLLAEDGKDNIVGVFFCLIDLLNRKEKSLIIKTIARDPGKKWSRLGHVLSNRVYRNAAKAGMKSMVHAFIRQEGTSTEISKHFSGQVYKNYAIYGKEIK